MKKGTKSVLFGVHCFAIHPFVVARAWHKLYGFPYDPRLWVAFFVHDLGYIGCENMDDEKGEQHPYLGAKIMHKLFDKKKSMWSICECFACKKLAIDECNKWHDFTLYHSRFLAKKHGKQYSKLCVADKYAICIEPSWMYIIRGVLSGEIYEYMKDADKNTNGSVKAISKYQWHEGVKEYVRKWVEEHKDIKEDTWTSNNRQANNTGVWK